MASPIIDEVSPISYRYPWAVHPVESWVIDELNKRSSEMDMNPTTGGNTRTYSGPKTAWARVFSNGISTLAAEKKGFIMGGVHGFDDSYGFNSKNEEIIGYDAEGKPHKLNANGYSRSYVSQNLKQANRDIPHPPPPNVLSIESSISAGINDSFSNTCKRTTIKWRCYSLAQLEYLTPYFLSPRISVVIEWGWNYYDRKSLIDLTDENWLRGAFEGTWTRTGKLIKDSGGNYEMGMGIITEYDISINADGGYDCTTVVSNSNVIVEGEEIESSVPIELSEQLRDLSGLNDEERRTIEAELTRKRRERAAKQDKPLKTMIEFLTEDSSLLANQGSVTLRQETTSRFIKKFESTGSVRRIYAPFIDKSGNKTSTVETFYLRMDLVVEIINSFYSLELLATEYMHAIGKGMTISEIDIKNVPICAHPAIKSCDSNILLPNKVAPRFVKKSDETTAPSLSELSGEYPLLFPTAVTQLNTGENSFDNTYDDLYKLINPDGNPFPMLKNYQLENGPIGGDQYPKKGYWGYLQDIYISNKLLLDLAQLHDTVLRLMEALLRKISEAMCNIPELKLISSPNSNTKYTVIDHNFTNIKYNNNSDSLPRIPLFSNNAAFMQNASVSVKMSPEMIKQMMVVNSTKKVTIQKGYGTFTTDLKILQQSKYLNGDRLFSCAVIPRENVVESNLSANRSQIHAGSLNSRKFSPQDDASTDTFVHVKIKKNSGNEFIYPIIAEKSKNFLKTIVMDPYDDHPTYTNNPLVPGSNFSIELLGIGGFSLFSQFTLSHVPDAFSYEKCVWQVIGIKHTIENNVWKTSITAQARPIQQSINNREGIRQ